MPVPSLDQLGWSAFFSRHLSIDDFTAACPARVVSVQRSGLTVLSGADPCDVKIPENLLDASGRITVGDWVMIERDAPPCCG